MKACHDVSSSICLCYLSDSISLFIDDVHESSEGEYYNARQRPSKYDIIDAYKCIIFLLPGFVLIAFYSAFNFKLIAPDDDLYIDGLTIKDFFCSGVHLADRNNENVSVIIDIFISQLLLGTGGTPELGGLFPASSFGIDCNPG